MQLGKCAVAVQDHYCPRCLLMLGVFATLSQCHSSKSDRPHVWEQNCRSYSWTSTTTPSAAWQVPTLRYVTSSVSFFFSLGQVWLGIVFSMFRTFSQCFDEVYCTFSNILRVSCSTIRWLFLCFSVSKLLPRTWHWDPTKTARTSTLQRQIIVVQFCKWVKGDPSRQATTTRPDSKNQLYSDLSISVSLNLGTKKEGYFLFFLGVFWCWMFGAFGCGFLAFWLLAFRPFASCCTGSHSLASLGLW